jgi:hypothetical protein
MRCSTSREWGVRMAQRQPCAVALGPRDLPFRLRGDELLLGDDFLS